MEKFGKIISNIKHDKELYLTYRIYNPDNEQSIYKYPIKPNKRCLVIEIFIDSDFLYNKDFIKKEITESFYSYIYIEDISDPKENNFLDNIFWKEQLPKYKIKSILPNCSYLHNSTDLEKGFFNISDFMFVKSTDDFIIEGDDKATVAINAMLTMIKQTLVSHIVMATLLIDIENENKRKFKFVENEE